MSRVSTSKILIVEDELIVAADIESRLKRMGYPVVGQADSAEEAVRTAGELQPDLVLMDIRLQGEGDGITAAEIIRQRFQLPVVYLTAHTDDATFQRAKITEPFGYVLKPFAERELRTVIEMALYKYAAERKLADSERRFATTLASIGEAVVATDAEGRITYLNPVAERMTGWSLSEAMGRPASEVIRLVDERSRMPLESPVDQVFETGEVVTRSQEAVMLSRDGHEYPIHDCTAPIVCFKGLTTGAVIVFRDVTDERKRQTELRQAQKLDAIGRLAGGVAHDFNNLLTVINNYCSMALSGLDSNNPLMSPLTEIAKAGGRAANLTSQLLAYGRRQMLYPKVVDLNRVIGDCRDLVRRMIPTSVEIDFNLFTEPLYTRVDPGKIEQVLINLAINARDAMSNGGRLQVATFGGENPSGQLPHIPGGAFVALVVSDNGCGMSVDTQSRIWEPFFTTKSQGKGTGLGLASVYGIVTQSGGHVSVKSDVGQGATFTVTLPRTDQTESESTSPEEIDSVGRMRQTVLVINQNATALDATATCLQAAGFDVLKAPTGLEALELAEAYSARLDLVVAELYSSSMSGRTLVKLLETGRPHIKSLFIGDGDAETACPIHLEGERKVPVLRRPFSDESLLAAIREILEYQASG